ncbi:hypothetical protein RFI_24565 [Reticulomyxa filosa]|uniref:Nucleolus and neural progenitor protein-like N-terminal domain-containing protein n=1 Tax=Reticulomyxa filosa TaxID=46433 RepID=X6MIC2_RETFI|nr:hypothetical protein RFI_24565 [Reticulomyxa filosa]|eukprot:ETO12810.1 hypothetical protein RFI_24565 [Reticulomyxa filosa]
MLRPKKKTNSTKQTASNSIAHDKSFRDNLQELLKNMNETLPVLENEHRLLKFLIFRKRNYHRVRKPFQYLMEVHRNHTKLLQHLKHISQVIRYFLTQYHTGAIAQQHRQAVEDMLNHCGEQTHVFIGKVLKCSGGFIGEYLTTQHHISLCYTSLSILGRFHCIIVFLNNTLARCLNSTSMHWYHSLSEKDVKTCHHASFPVRALCVYRPHREKKTSSTIKEKINYSEMDKLVEARKCAIIEDKKVNKNLTSVITPKPTSNEYKNTMLQKLQIKISANNVNAKPPVATKRPLTQMKSTDVTTTKNQNIISKKKKVCVSCYIIQSFFSSKYVFKNLKRTNKKVISKREKKNKYRPKTRVLNPKKNTKNNWLTFHSGI